MRHPRAFQQVRQGACRGGLPRGAGDSHDRTSRPIEDHLREDRDRHPAAACVLHDRRGLGRPLVHHHQVARTSLRILLHVVPIGHQDVPGRVGVGSRDSDRDPHPER